MSKRRPPKVQRQAARMVAGGPAAKSAVPVASYDAAGQGRRLKSWRPASSGPNRALSGLQTIRNRSRDAGRNEWAGASSARVWKTNLIGTGIVPRPITKDADSKARQKQHWDDFCKESDADGVFDFYGQQTLAVGAMIESGEVFARFRPRRPGDGLAVPLQVQILEADMVPLLDRDLPDGNKIRSGKEFSRIGRLVAFWVHKSHPGDGYSSGIDLSELSRVPAEQMRHIYQPTRPGQLRGVSLNAPVLAKLRSVMDMDDAVLVRQHIGNLFGLVVTTSEGPRPGIDPITGLQYQSYADDEAPPALEPGATLELRQGQDVKFPDPPDAGANYHDFMREQGLGIAAGSGTPYELMKGDIKDVGDRTLRVIINEFRRLCEQVQWQVIIPMLCQPTRDAWADACVLAGHFTPQEGAEAKRVTWAPQGWAYMHPTQDAQGEIMRVEAGLSSRAAIAAARGDDIEQIDAERADDAAREAAHGLSSANTGASSQTV